MRLIIYGLGAIGGAVAAGLTRAGREVVGIARGDRLAALRERGLRFRTPLLEDRVRFPLVEDPARIEFRSGDALLLALKTQHVESALDRLRAAGWTSGPIFCALNGIESERLTLRRFPNVHGVLVMMPASYLDIDEACAYSHPRHGVFESGLPQGGCDEDDLRFAELMEVGNIGGFAVEDVMAAKTGKLLLNLGNVIGAAFGERDRDDGDPAALRAAARAEAETVLRAAGRPWREVGAADPRRDALMKQGEIAGARRAGSSTAQSLARGVGDIETDFLNGEIALHARLAGVPAPINAHLAALGARMARDGAAPGSADLGTELAAMRAAGASV
ncbi:MAG: 2-dehydropantoate 2-reductase N-terminal domain-containing protein [Pseudomonadota bacterium]